LIIHRQLVVAHLCSISPSGAHETLLTNQRSALALRTEQMTASAQLIVALGGSWDASRLTR